MIARIDLPPIPVSLLLAAALLAGCQQPEQSSAPISSQTPSGGPCVCYCLSSWIGPIAAPDVPDPGYPAVNFIGNKETEIGTTFWDANVTAKNYVCGTTNVLNQTTSVVALAHHKYRIVRTRSWNWGSFAWGPWGTPTRTNDPPNSDKIALGSTAPPSLPHCPDVGIACP